MSLRHIVILIAIIATAVATLKNYNGFKAYKVTPSDEAQVEVLKELMKTENVVFWNEVFKVNDDVRVMVERNEQASFQDRLNTAGINFQVTLEDIGKLIEDQTRSGSADRSTQYLGLDWETYYDTDAIYNWLDAVAAEFPDVVTVVSMGESLEGRDIKGIIIDYNRRPNGVTYVSMIESTIHAREWITPATVTWIIKEFLTSTDPDVRSMAESIQWHIFPVTNPDGYTYTFTHDRMWRKNRRINNVTSCDEGVDDGMSIGVDLNRNFGYVWNTVGASDDPCSNLYAGPEAFSEPEAQAIRDYVLSLSTRGTWMYYLAFHSYTQLICIPYSHTSGFDVLLSGNYADMYEVAARTQEKIAERYGTIYRFGTSPYIMYEMSGGSFDWVKYATGVPMAFLFELRDLGRYGFLLPPDQIIPTSLETMDGLIEMDKTVIALGYHGYQGVETSGAAMATKSVAMGLIALLAVLVF